LEDGEVPQTPVLGTNSDVNGSPLDYTSLDMDSPLLQDTLMREASRIDQLDSKKLHHSRPTTEAARGTESLRTGDTQSQTSLVQPSCSVSHAPSELTDTVSPIEGSQAWKKVVSPSLYIHPPESRSDSSDDSLSDCNESPLLKVDQKYDTHRQEKKKLGFKLESGNGTQHYKCKVEECKARDAVFSNLSSLRRHWDNAHVLIVNKFECPWDKCKAVLTRKNDLKYHMTTRHKLTGSHLHSMLTKPGVFSKKKNDRYRSPKGMTSPFSVSEIDLTAKRKYQHSPVLAPVVERAARSPHKAHRSVVKSDPSIDRAVKSRDSKVKKLKVQLTESKAVESAERRVIIKDQERTGVSGEGSMTRASACGESAKMGTGELLEQMLGVQDERRRLEVKEQELMSRWRLECEGVNYERKWRASEERVKELELKLQSRINNDLQQQQQLKAKDETIRKQKATLMKLIE